MVAEMLRDEHGEMYTLAVRFSNSLTNLIRPICEAVHLVPPEEKSAAIEGLKKIYRKINCPLNEQNTDKVVAIGDTTRILAGDLAFLLRRWHYDDVACEKKIIELDVAAGNLAVVMEEIKEWRSRLGNDL